MSRWLDTWGWGQGRKKAVLTKRVRAVILSSPTACITIRITKQKRGFWGNVAGRYKCHETESVQVSCTEIIQSIIRTRRVCRCVQSANPCVGRVEEFSSLNNVLFNPWLEPVLSCHVPQNIKLPVVQNITNALNGRQNAVWYQRLIVGISSGVF